MYHRTAPARHAYDPTLSGHTVETAAAVVRALADIEHHPAAYLGLSPAGEVARRDARFFFEGVGPVAVSTLLVSL